MAKQQSNFSSFGMVPAAAAAVGFVIAAALSVLVLKSGVDGDHRATMGEALAKEYAKQVNARETAILNQMTQLGSNKMVTLAFSGTATDRLEAESLLVTLIPFADKVSLIPSGQARIDQSFPPFNYTALDQVNRVESGQATYMEAISTQPQLAGDKWVIVAAPVKPVGGDLLGTLFVYFKTGVITDGLTDGNAGQLAVLQTVGTTPRNVSTIGSGSDLSFNQPLDNPNWQLVYSPSPVLAASSPGNIVLYLVPALVLLLMAVAGAFVNANQVGASIKKNLELLMQYASKLAAGNDEPADYTAPGFTDAEIRMKTLVQQAPRAAQPAAEKPKPKVAKPPAAAPAKEEAMVDIEMVDDAFEEVEELDVDDFDEAVAEANKPAESSSEISPAIFRAYDIRGVVGESLSEVIARQIGLAIGSEAEARGEQTLLVGYDGRDYSPALAEALIEGLTSSGRDVINIGAVPTPVLYYGTHNSTTTSGVMVTGSHNAPNYNGFKIVLGGKTLVDKDIQALYQRIQDGDFAYGEGTVSESDIAQDYLDAVIDDVVVAQPLKVVIDCGNGIAGTIAPELFDALGCEIVPLYCEVDGSFPNHHPDPTKPENIEDLALTVQSQGADLGIAFDGDGDRLVAVTADGEIVWPDRLLMLFAKDIVSRNPGSDVVYDVKCTRHLNSVISGFGGRPIMSRSGHSFVKEKIAETGALLGGEMSGHICFSERWFGFDDGLYSAARLLEIVGSQQEGLADLLKEFPASLATPEIHVAVADNDKFALIESLVAAADFEDATLTTIDGLRVDFTDGWGLVRASNTEPAITLRFEADSEESLEDIKGAFRELLQETREDLDF